MKHRSLFLILSILCFSVILLSACAKKSVSPEALVSPDQSIFELASAQYDREQLLEIRDESGTIGHFNALYPVECMRKLQDGTYRASYLGDGEIASVCFDASGEKLRAWVYSVGAESAAFSDLKTGDPLESVMKIDPDGAYLFLYAGRDDVSKVSEHYCADGYLITIEYSYASSEDAPLIADIRKELI